jgi:hypothetical protein
VTDRKKWKDIARQVKAHSGLQCQWKKKKKKYIICDNSRLSILLFVLYVFVPDVSCYLLSCGSILCCFSNWPSGC